MTTKTDEMPLSEEELRSFYDYAERNLQGPTGDKLQWADYTIRLIDEVRRYRKAES